MGLAAGAAIGAVGAIGSAAIGSSAASSAANAQTQAAQQAQQTQLQMYNQTRSDLSPFMSGGSNAFSQLANIFGFGGGFGAGGTQLPSANYGAATGAGGSQLSGGGFSIPGIGSVNIPGYGGASGTVPANVNPQNTGQPNPALATQLLTQFPGYQFGLTQGVQALDRSAASRGMALSGGQLKDLNTFGQQYGMAQAWQPYISELNNAASLGENAAAQVGNSGVQTGSGVAASQLAAGQSQAAGSVAQGNIWSSALSGVTNAVSPLLSSYGNTVGGYQSGLPGTGADPNYGLY